MLAIPARVIAATATTAAVTQQLGVNGRPLRRCSGGGSDHLLNDDSEDHEGSAVCLVDWPVAFW